MIEADKFIIFQCSEFLDELDEYQIADRQCKFWLGSYNKTLVSKLLLYNGLTPTDRTDFTLVWGSSPEVDDIPPRSIHQRFNHFPYSKKILGNKAEFAYIIQNHPRIRDFPRFLPRTFILPRDRDQLFRHMRSAQQTQFIAKPPKGSCGHGIKLVTFSDFYSIGPDSVVSEYIAHPLCIDGFKFDLRIYVLVTSFAPLRAFVSREGLARFATESYSTVTSNVYSHLTNATLNKHGRNWCSEFKWKLTEVLKEIQHRWRRSPGDIMHSILETVARTLAIVQRVMAPSERRTMVEPFFELYGFDILLDRDFKTWLLEVNTYPALGTEEDVDFDVKGLMVAQALSIAGVPDLTAAELLKLADTSSIRDLGEFERIVIEREDERNAASGNGFMRIFPSPESAPLEAILAIPKVLGPLALARAETMLDPLKYAKMLNGEQAMDVLVSYLVMLQKRVEDGKAPRDAPMRITSFLAAQGYQVGQPGMAVKSALRNFVDRHRAKPQANGSGGKGWTIGTMENILNEGVDLVAQLLLNVALPVRNLRTLFF
jgi:tubulin polyglutamylase TTLL5